MVSVRVISGASSNKPVKTAIFCLALFVYAFRKKWPRTLPALMLVGCAEEVVSTVGTCQGI